MDKQFIYVLSSMNITNILRKNFIYFFISLPFVIILYEVFMTLAINNRAYYLLTLGQIFLVPLVFLVLSFIHDKLLGFSNFVSTIVFFSIALIILVILCVYGNNLPA